MLKLFWALLKILTRNRQALFWSLFFPLMFTIIFGFFFGKGNNSAGTVALVNHADTSISQTIEKTMENTNLFKVDKNVNEKDASTLISNGKLSALVVIPENFGAQTPDSPTKIKVLYDPGNLQSSAVIVSYLNNVLTGVNYQIQNAKPIYGVDEEKTNTHILTYFDFVLVGLIGLALMNSSVQGIAINMATYREEMILKRLTTTPLQPWRFIIAQVISNLILNIFQISLILAIGVYGFGAHIYGSYFLIYLFGIIGAILFLSIGFVITSFSKTAQAAQGMATAITIPMMFLAGVFFPIDQLPKWLFSIVQFLPLAPLLRMIRQIALESISPFSNPTNIIIVLAWIIIGLTIASLRFRLSDE